MGDGRILVQATVTAIGDEHFLYPCCIQCYSKLLHDVHHARWRCLKCGVSCLADELEWRYRLRLTIADSQEYRQVAVFGKTVQPFFGASANTFQRFLDHLQKTESDLADIVLKQAVDCVFVGHSFLFGFASATKQKPIMTVSCLSNVKDTMGSNSDLIAVQMICQDQSQMTTVSQQMSLMFKEILSSSLHQLSSADDSKEESFSKSRSWNRMSSNESWRSCFNSILELSENCSMNSIASLLLSCENSFLKNLTTSPGSLSHDFLDKDNKQKQFDGQEVEQHANPEENEDKFKRSEDQSKFDDYEGDETRFDFEHKLESEDTRYEEPSFSHPYDGLVYSEDVSDYLQDVSPTGQNPENSFHDTLNDSSLLLADKDDCLQLLGDRIDAGVDWRRSSSSSRTSEVSTHSEVFADRKISMTKSEEEQRACDPQDCVMVESVFDNKMKDNRQQVQDYNEWEEMPYSEDLEEFLANAVHESLCDVTEQPHETTEQVRASDANSTGMTNMSVYHCNDFEPLHKTNEPLHETIEQLRTSDANSTLTVLKNIPSFMCQDDKHEETNNITVNCSEISVKVSKEDTLSNINNMTAVSMIDMPESENLDQFLQLAAFPQIDLEEMYDYKHPVIPPGAPVSFNNISRTVCANLTTSKLNDPITDYVQRVKPGIKSMPSQMGNCEIIQDTEPREDSSDLQEDLEMYFSNSFSPDGYGGQSSKLPRGAHSSSVSNQESDQQISCDTSRHCKEDEAGCEKSIVEDNQSTCAKANIKNDVKSTGDHKHLLDQTGTCHMSYKSEPNESAPCQRPPGYLFHPVASIGSLNYSNDLFDTSGDLFESSQMEDEEPPTDLSSLEPKDSCMEAPLSPQSHHQSAVCESVDESHGDCPGTENITEETESKRKQVKFARRLSHVSTVQLIDIRMKLNFGNRSETTPVKSCIRNKPDMPRRMILVDGSESVKKSLFLNKEIFGLEGDSERTGTWNDAQVRRNILVEDSEPISDVSMENSSDESMVQNNYSSKDTDFCTFSQDLFACSQPMDTHLIDIEHEDCESVDVAEKQEVDKNTDSSFSENVSGTLKFTINSSKIRNSLCSGQQISTKEILPSVLYVSPCDGSPLLFSQVDPSDLDSQVTSTPAEDPGQMMLPLTPDLFSP